MKKTVFFIILLSAVTVSAYLLLANNTGDQAQDNTGIEATTVSLNETTVNRSANVSTQPAMVDQIEDAGTVIQFDGNSITVEGPGAEVTGSIVTISSAGTYSLSGELNDGQVKVETEDDDPVRVILNGVSLTASNTSPLYVANADETIIILQNNTENYLEDGATYVFTEEGTDEPNATLFSEDDLVIEGGGNLFITANYNDGIGVKDDLDINSGTIQIQAADDGIRSKDKLTIINGNITIEANGDGFKSDNSEDSDEGNIFIEGGMITITSGGDAIQAESNIEITGGEFNLNTSERRTSGQTGSSSKGLNAGDSLLVSGESFTINTSDDAVHSNNYLKISSGTFTISTDDDAIHADTLLVIDDGNINITESYEGIESQVVRINGGEISLKSSDDGFSIASGSGGGQRGGWGGRGGGSSANLFLYIHGGNIYIDSGGDGIDSNGSVEMTAGNLVVSGPTMSGNGAIDYDGGYKITGGLIAAAGSSGMAEIPDASSTQNSVMVYLESGQSGGTLFTVLKEDGEPILSFRPEKDYQSVALSSPQFEIGSTYEVYVGGNANGQQENRVYVGGEYTPGTRIATFTINGVNTTVGEGGRGFGGRRGWR